MTYPLSCPRPIHVGSETSRRQRSTRSSQRRRLHVRHSNAAVQRTRSHNRRLTRTSSGLRQHSGGVNESNIKREGSRFRSQ